MKLDDIRIDRKFASRLPPAPPAQMEALVESIRERGVLVPLLVNEDGLLVDGHRRLEAAKLAGLKDAPARKVKTNGARTWGKAFAILTNLHRRHLNEAQRADLASSLLRVERVKAKERQRKGKGADGSGGRGKKKPSHDGHAKVSSSEQEKNKAAARAARAAGVSTQTLERVERVKKADPELAGRMLAGKVSIAGANKKVAAREIAAETKAEASRQGFVRDLKTVAGKWLTILADPPWEYRDSGTQGAAAGHYSTMPVEEIGRLPVGALAKGGKAHLWLWTTWPMIREGAPQEVLRAWGFRWVGELVWRKPGLGVGHWMRPSTEILILAERGKLPLRENDQRGDFEARKGRHSEKPAEAYEIVERLSFEPRIELFARRARNGWSRWGLEA